MAAYTLFNGWVTSVLWNWFVPNIFDNVPSLSIGEAIGLSLVISAFIFIPTNSRNKDVEDSWALFLATVLVGVGRNIMLLAFGAIVYSYVF